MATSVLQKHLTIMNGATTVKVLVTELKKCYEEENSDKQNECNLKSALIGMNFASIEKNEKNIHRMEMILYPNKKQTIQKYFYYHSTFPVYIGSFIGNT